MNSAMDPHKIHHTDPIRDVQVFTDEDGESYFAIGVGDKLKVHPLKYEQKPEFQEYTLPSEIAGVTAVHRGGKKLSQLLIVTTDGPIYSLHAHHLSRLWSQESKVDRRDFDMAWESVSENQDHLVVFFRSDPIVFQLTFLGNIVSSIFPISFQSGAKRFKYNSVLRKMVCDSSTYESVSAPVKAMEYITPAFDCIRLQDAFVFIRRTDLVLACPNFDIKIHPQEKTRLEVGWSGLVILRRVGSDRSIRMNLAICHVKLDENRVLICWDGELFLLCIQIKSTRSMLFWRKARKMNAQPTRTLKQFEVFYLSRFIPTRWVVRVEQNLFLAIGTHYYSFYFQLSSHKPFYKVVSIFNFSSTLPMTHLEVFQDDRKSGPWTVQSKSLLFSQGTSRRSLLVLEEKCIQAQEVLLTLLPSNDTYHSLWDCGGDLLIEGTREKVCFRIEKRSVDTQTRNLGFIGGVLDAADDKVMTHDMIFCLESNGEMEAVSLMKSASWGKICNGCIVIVTSDDELELYDEKYDLIYQEKLASEYIFFQAERNNGTLLFIAANYKGIIECRVVDLYNAQCNFTQHEIGKIPNSALIERNDDGFTIYLGCEKGCLTFFTLNTNHQVDPQHIILTKSEELLIVHLSSPSRIVVRTCTETFIASINVELKICELSVVPSLRKARSMTNTSEGLVILDDENRLRLIHLAETSTNQVNCVPLKGKVKTFITILKDHHHHPVAIVLYCHKYLQEDRSRLSLTVVDIRTKKRTRSVVVSKTSSKGLQLYPFLSEENNPACFILHTDSKKFLCYLKPDCTLLLKEIGDENTPSGDDLAAAKLKQLSNWFTGNTSSLNAGFNRAAHVERLLNEKIRYYSHCLIAHNLSLFQDLSGVTLHRVAKDFQTSKEFPKLPEKLEAVTTDVLSSPQVFYIGTGSGNIYRYSLRD